MEHRWHQSIEEIPRDLWNVLDSDSPTPLLSWEWLAHLERSGSVSPETGWHPHHLTYWEGAGLIGAVPLYLRDHSWGEFVFDFAFADLADQFGLAYYPKLVGMSPVSPTPAFRFLTVPGREREITTTLFTLIRRWCIDNDIPVLQFNFVIPEWVEHLSTLGMQPWQHHGFEWINEGLASFDQYINRFTKNQRRNIRRERRSMIDQGLSLEVLPADTAHPKIFQRMAEYYHRTNDQFGPYAARFLDGRFFTEMPKEVRRHVFFVGAFEEGEGAPGDDPLALSMLIRKGDRLIGRYWGTRAYRKDLHFNACYYTPIEWAINEGIRVFDPGMGSPHKARRGFRSVPNWSLHYFFRPEMQAILEANIDHINAQEGHRIRRLDRSVPVKKQVGRT